MHAEMHHDGAVLLEPGDRAIAAIAQRQHGVVSTEQLHLAGLSRGAIALRVRNGRLHRVHRGVYVVGVPRLTPRGRFWAAVLACGGPEAAALSHHTAAHVWRLRETARTRIDVLSLRAAHSTAAIHVHSSRTLDAPRDVTLQHDGLPLTTPARTLVDLAATLSPHDLERACHEAEFHSLIDARAIGVLLETAPRGAPKLRAALARLAETGPQIPRTTMERRFLTLVDRFDLPPPLVNHPLLGYTVDFFWPAYRLVVETDGRDAHSTAAAFEKDRERDALLQLHGFRVVRFTWRQIIDRPRYVADTVRALAR